MADGLVEHVVGIELAGELPAGPCKPLRQRPGATLSLVQLASLQSAARRAGDPLGQRELLVVEHLFGLVEDEHEPDAAARRLRQGHGQQRAPAGRSRRTGEPLAEAAVVDQPVRREQLAAASARRQRGRILLEVVGEPCGELVRAGQLELVPDRPQHRRRVAAERLCRSLRDRVVGRLRRQRLAEHGRDPVEAALDLSLARALAQEPARVDRDRRLVGDRLRERDLGRAARSSARRGAARARRSPARTRRSASRAPRAEPRSASSRTWPRVVSISSGASRTSLTASVRCSRAARFTTGRRVRSSSGATPAATHCADKGACSPGSPRRMKQRSARIPFAVSSTATRSSSSRSRSDRTSREMWAISRSRSSASASPAEARVRASARPASATSACICASSSSANRRGRRTAGEDDAHDLTAGEHRHEGAALHARELVQPLVDDRRALGVEDRERRALARHGADAGRLVLEVELLADQALVVATAVPRRDRAARAGRRPRSAPGSRGRARRPRRARRGARARFLPRRPRRAAAARAGRLRRLARSARRRRRPSGAPRSARTAGTAGEQDRRRARPARGRRAAPR